MGATADNDELATGAVVEALAELGRLDLLYADRYLQRAEASLGERCTPERFHAIRRDEQALARAVAELRAASERGEWGPVRSLARQAATCAAASRGARRLHASARSSTATLRPGRPLPCSR